MTPLRWRLVIWLQLGWVRCNVVTALVAALLPIGAVAWLLATAHVHARVDALQQVLMDQRRQRAVPRQAVPAVPADMAALAAFTDVLGEPSGTERYLGTVLAAARQHRVTVAEGRYRISLDAAAQIDRYAIRLPVSGRDVDIRLFCDQVLRALPFASLDVVELKRSAVSEGMLSATLEWTLLLHAGQTSAVGTPP
ncbi:MAG: hypothetical protein QE285_19375 [Aquabacterium sp.]|nr:hypothetical protein [Aquabacterium sp.]